MNELYSLHVNMIDYFQKHNVEKKIRCAEGYLQCNIIYMKSKNLLNNTIWCFKAYMYIW